MAKSKGRILVGKPGLDGHDRGAKVVARALRDAGYEVIYTGLHQTPEMIVDSAVQEDVDVVGLSILSGAHLELFPQIISGLKERGMANVILVAGGIIPESDRDTLMAMGIRGIFGPGSSMRQVSSFVLEAVETQRNPTPSQE